MLLYRYFAGPNVSNLSSIALLEVLTKYTIAYDEQSRTMWVSRVLPIDMFSEICRRVYFAIDDYSEVDFILANGYLSYIFAENLAVTGQHDYLEYFRLCRENVHKACGRLPLLIPPSMEVIAALTIGVRILGQSIHYTIIGLHFH